MATATRDGITLHYVRVRSICPGIDAITGRDDLVGHLTEIRVPTFVVVGEEDKALPLRKSRRIASSIPGAELVVIPQVERLAFGHGALPPTGGLGGLAEPAAVAAGLTERRVRAWVVYGKLPFAGPDHGLADLGRYTHRVAISNQRRVALTDGRVRFRWRDYADEHRVKVMELEAAEFLRRFLGHGVPDGFVRIRRFGLVDSCQAGASPPRIRRPGGCLAALALVRRPAPARRAVPIGGPRWPLGRPVARSSAF